jgi:hypothetical protein
LALRDFVQEARRTLKSWKIYRDQTGEWPWLWIAAHSLNWIVTILGMVFVIWWSGEHHLSKWNSAGVLALVYLPYGLFWLWFKGKVKVNQLKRQRHLAAQRKSR